MIFHELQYGSEGYLAACSLRDQVLRMPLGLRLSDADREGEAEQLHFGGLDHDGILVACVIAVPQSGSIIKVRQMAVAENHQGRGVGRALMDAVHAELQSRGWNHFVLNARVSAVGFYEKLGYLASGDEFMEVGIPHLRMARECFLTEK
jgi:predicted GNAT family N-acyltransferase